MIVDARASPLGRAYVKSALAAARRAHAAYAAGDCGRAFVWFALSRGAVDKDAVVGEEGRAARKVVGALQDDLARSCLLPRGMRLGAETHAAEQSRSRTRRAQPSR